MKMQASAAWQGGFQQGQGTISTESGALTGYPYSRSSRFELGEGSNPEELIAAAHASCFTMALSRILEMAKLTAEQLNTTADVFLEEVEGGFAITTVHLKLRATIPGATPALFRECAEEAKAFCPVSKVLKATITLDAQLIS